MKFLRLITNEFVKGVWVSRRYPLDLLVGLVVLAVLYLGVYGANRLAAQEAGAASTFVRSLVGFVMWYFVALIIGALSTSLQSEAEQGTIEHVFLASGSPAVFLLARQVAVILRGAIEVAVVFGGLIILNRIPLGSAFLPGLTVVTLSLIGLIGFGFMLAGLTLLYKRITSVTGLLNLLFLILMGVFNTAEGVMATVVKVMPLGYGSHLLTEVLKGSAPSGYPWITALAKLLVLSLAYVALGIAVYWRAERHARRQGVLSQF